MADLPRPNVTVSKPTPPEGAVNSEHSIDVVISRDGKARSYSADGASSHEAVEKVVRQIIDDPRTAEWLPKPA